MFEPDAVEIPAESQDELLPIEPRSRRVLIAERSASLRERIRSMLTGLGMLVDEAETPDQALVACRQNTPDLILLDGQIARGSGLQLLDRLQALSPADPPRVIYCASSHLFDDIWGALERGADEYLLKPFDEVNLSAKMRALGLLNDEEAARAALASAEAA